jgi:hypothetical protein
MNDTAPKPNDPSRCVHRVDFDMLVSQSHRKSPLELSGGGMRLRLSAECANCGALVTLDQALTHLLERVTLSERKVQMLLIALAQAGIQIDVSKL